MEQAFACLDGVERELLASLLGKASVNGHILSAGDGAALSGEALVRIEGIDASEVLVFDLA